MSKRRKGALFFAGWMVGAFVSPLGHAVFHGIHSDADAAELIVAVVMAIVASILSVYGWEGAK